MPALFAVMLSTIHRGGAPDHPAPDPAPVELTPTAPPAPLTLKQAVETNAAPLHPVHEVDCLARTVYFEARGDGLEGQLAVARTVINRTRSEIFPDTICEVVRQPHQFSFVRDRIIPEVDRQSRAWRTAVAVALVARQGWPSRAAHALFFHAPYVSPGWKRPALGRIGAHFFYL
jgi:spore germination cell wall hydrolase CwlJ-like protein